MECILPPPHSLAESCVGGPYVILAGSASCICTFRTAFPPQCRACTTYREKGGWGGSGRNGTLGRKRAGIPLGNLVGNLLSNLHSSVMVGLKHANGPALPLRRRDEAKEFRVLCLLLLICGRFCRVDLRLHSNLCPLTPPPLPLSVLSRFRSACLFSTPQNRKWPLVAGRLHLRCHLAAWGGGGWRDLWQ